MKRSKSLGTQALVTRDSINELPSPPQSIRVIRILGSGRAARAQLVEATFADGSTVTCVEKVFDPGLLTRTIYRLSFQSSFGYQKNRHAIVASFYRRRVAGAILAASDIAVAGEVCSPPNVASPLYVRFDQDTKSWVLAAQWIKGRGIKPAPADPARVGRRWRWGAGRGQVTAPRKRFEIDEIVDVMRQSEQLFQKCGLVGSGWQVSPRAMVSTANLLRVGDRYTIIDLESGIPAVLVPSYLLSGMRQGQLPPFDDLDPVQLRRWLDEQASLIKFRIGPEATEQLFRDATKLIEHSDAWKKSEIAFFRRPWSWLSADRWRRYRVESLRRWQQDGIIDTETAKKLTESPAAKTFGQVLIDLDTLCAAFIDWSLLGTFGRAQRYAGSIPCVGYAIAISEKDRGRLSSQSAKLVGYAMEESRSNES